MCCYSVIFIVIALIVIALELDFHYYVNGEVNMSCKMCFETIILKLLCICILINYMLVVT
jgi:hypothetical protein